MVKIGSKEYAVIVTWLSSIQTKVELCDGEEVFSSTCDASSHQPQSRRSSESAETFLISVMEALCHCKMEKYELTLSPSSTSNASSNSDNDVATTLTILVKLNMYCTAQYSVDYHHHRLDLMT